MVFKQVNGVLSGGNVNVRDLAKTKAQLKGGGVANTCMFEPRLLHLGVDLTALITQIAVATDELVFRSLLVLNWKADTKNHLDDTDLAVLSDTAAILDACGSALATDDEKHYKTLQDFVGDKMFDRMAAVGSENFNAAENVNPEDSNASFIYKQALEVRAATLAYLRAFHHGNIITRSSAEKSFLHIMKTAVVFCFLPLVPTIRPIQALSLIFEPKKWNFSAIMWSFELSAGFVALMAMSVYWDAYENFRINPFTGDVGAGKCLAFVKQYLCVVQNDSHTQFWLSNSL